MTICYILISYRQPVSSSCILSSLNFYLLSPIMFFNNLVSVLSIFVTLLLGLFALSLPVKFMPFILRYLQLSIHHCHLIIVYHLLLFLNCQFLWADFWLIHPKTQYHPIEDNYKLRQLKIKCQDFSGTQPSKHPYHLQTILNTNLQFVKALHQ